jgi:hypothetical protein
MNRLTHVLSIVGACGLLTLAASSSRADDVQAAPDSQVSSNSQTEASTEPRNFQPFTVGAEIGTTGYGGAADWRFSNHWGIGGGFDYLSYNYNNGKIEDATYDVRLRLQSEPLNLNIYPWSNHSFHISVGAFFDQNHLSGSAFIPMGDSVTIGNNTYNGPFEMDLSIKQQPVDPYIGIGGNLYFDHGHHVSLRGTLGVVYTGTPKVTYTVPAFVTPEDQQSEQNKINHYAKDFQFWPVVKLSLNYSF